MRNVDSSTKFYMYLRFLQLIIRAQVGDLSSHSTKYSSIALTQKVFANMRRVGKGFFGVETPLFEGMIVAHQADDVADEGVAGVDVDVVPAADEPSISSPIPIIQPLPPSQELPSTSQALPTLPPSPIAQPLSLQQQPQPSQPSLDAEISMDLLHTLLETYTTLTRRGKIKANMDTDEDVTLKDVVVVSKEVQVGKDVEIEENADDDELEPVELKKVVEVVTTTKLMTEVVTAVAATITAAETLITVATITTAPNQVQRKEKEDDVVMRYQALKRKPQAEAQARKNMMIYLRNMVRFKMDYFKGISYDDIHLIFEQYFNSNVAFLEKTKEQMEEEDNKAL
nr:hypothetical protein [Tanacetum cinerariifolium]